MSFKKDTNSLLGRRTGKTESPAAASGGTMPSVLAPNLAIKGNLIADGDIQIDGTVDGDVRGNAVTIGESGKVNGSVEAELVTVAGQIEGTIKAKRIVARSTARLMADLDHEIIEVEAGAKLIGALRQPDASSSKITSLPNYGKGDEAETA